VHVVSFKSGSGYRAQLDRARRFLDRVQSLDPRRDVDYQDDVWAFFQNCWHIKDWLKHDYRVPASVRDRAIAAAHRSKVLQVCRDMGNGTKHRKLEKRGKPVRARAVHLWTNTRMVPLFVPPPSVTFERIRRGAPRAGESLPTS
jgi:hypothetical protein